MAQQKPTMFEIIDLNEVRVAAMRLLGVPKLPSGIEKELGAAVPRHRKLLGRLQSAHVDGCHERMRRAIVALEKSRSSQLIAFILANGKGRSIRHFSWDALKSASRQINPRKPNGEYVWASTRHKPKGGYRSTCSFGPVSRGTQKLIEHILLSTVGHSRFEYARKGRGREAAIRETLHSIKMKGVRWFGLLDVREFFPSITREMVQEVLGFLPASYINASFFIHKDTEIRHKRLYRDNTNKSSEAAIRNGLPQGSLISVLVASLVLDRHLTALNARHAISHVDDILIGGKTEQEVQAKIDALASSLEGHHSGSLYLTGQPFEIGDHRMHYLGYRFRRRSAQFGGYGRAMFSEQSRYNFLKRMAAKLLFVHWEHRFDVIPEECARWVRSFPNWENRIESEDFAVMDVEENLLPMLDLTKKILTAYPTKWTGIHEMQEFLDRAAPMIAETTGKSFTTGGDLGLERQAKLAQFVFDITR